MSNLKSDYQAIEESLYWPEKPDPRSTDQFYRLVNELKVEVRERSLSENLNPSLYANRLYTLLDFVSNLQDALNFYPVVTPDQKKDEQRVWFHRDYKVSVLSKRDDDPKINREWLLEAAATYLANPWMQNDQVDWIIIDSLIFAEISAYGESILTGQVSGKMNWAYILSDGDMMKVYWYKITEALGFIALRYIIPSAIIFLLYYYGHETGFLIAGAVYAIYLVLHIVLWPLRYRKRKLEEKTLQEHMERLQKMVDTYYYCKPPIVSLSMLCIYLNKAVESGAIFDSALFSVLKRVEESKGEAFMPFKKSA